MADKATAHIAALAAYMAGDVDAIARHNREWGIVITPNYSDDDVPEPDDYENTRELSDYEYDRIADNYERNWV